MVQVVSDWTRGKKKFSAGGLVLERTIRIVSDTEGGPNGKPWIRAVGPSVTLRTLSLIEVIRLDVFNPEDPGYVPGPHWHSVVHRDDQMRLDEGISEGLHLGFNPRQWFVRHLNRKTLVEIMLAADRGGSADWLEEKVDWPVVETDLLPHLGKLLYDQVMPLHELATLERPD